MTDLEKNRAQRDARRTVAGRRTTPSSHPEQAVLRHLGVEAYKERNGRSRRADKADKRSK
jgi:hypothetical protein